MGEADGATPIAGLTKDAAGTLYGTAEFGGLFQSCSASSCGTVYKVVRRGSTWLTTPIYSFKGAPDGATPTSRVIFGPDGSLYGTTMYGGTGSCLSTVSGCGTVFKLQRPATFARALSARGERPSSIALPRKPMERIRERRSRLTRRAISMALPNWEGPGRVRRSLYGLRHRLQAHSQLGRNLEQEHAVLISRWPQRRRSTLSPE